MRCSFCVFGGNKAYGMSQWFWNNSSRVIFAKLGFIQQRQYRMDFSKVYVDQWPQDSRMWSLIVECGSLSGGFLCRAVFLTDKCIPLPLVNPNANVVVLLSMFWLNGPSRSLEKCRLGVQVADESPHAT